MLPLFVPLSLADGEPQVPPESKEPQAPLELEPEKPQAPFAPEPPQDRAPEQDGAQDAPTRATPAPPEPEPPQTPADDESLHYFPMDGPEEVIQVQPQMLDAEQQPEDQRPPAVGELPHEPVALAPALTESSLERVRRLMARRAERAARKAYEEAYIAEYVKAARKAARAAARRDMEVTFSEQAAAGEKKKKKGKKKKEKKRDRDRQRKQ